MSANAPAGLGNGNGTEEARIGVFICHCGGNISDVIDVEKVASEVGALPGVVLATTYMFLCSDPGQALIEEQIKKLRLNRIIVAACSPTLHQLTFRRCLDRAGLNQFLFEHVNIREQVSWVIEDKDAATRKAIRLVSAAVGRANHLIPLKKRSIPIHPAALVVGGGVAGLVAARDLAKRGMRVTLVESRPFLGGRMSQLHTVFPTAQNARDLLSGLIEEVVNHPFIKVYTNAKVLGSEGVVGNFRSRIQLTPRGVDERLLYPGNAIAACPEETYCEFDYGMKKRKAIYMAYPGCYPPMPAIDWGSCTRCGKCLGATAGKGITLDDTPQEIEVHSGVVVLATGYDPYEPMYGEYGYLIFPEVVTLQQLNRMLDPFGPTGGTLLYQGKKIKRIAFIHCVGARQVEGVNLPTPDGKLRDYCARTCCTAALHAAQEIKKLVPDAELASLFQDIRAYGRGHEEYYKQASESGVMFINYDPKSPPQVTRDPEGKSALLVKTRDRLTENMEVEMPADLVVLATGVGPHDISELVEMYRCAVGFDSFLLEVHPKLRPVELAVSGVFLAGSCQGPLNISECAAAASAAASKAAALIAQGTVEMDPFIAKVDEELCSGCQTCLSICPYDAISRDDRKSIATVGEALCTGCGTCVATCPSNAITQLGFTDEQISSQIDMLLAEYAAQAK